MRAQQVTFQFQDGLYDTKLKADMESAISELLSEFNNAHREQRSLRLNGMTLTEQTRRSLTYTWDSLATFTCDFDRNVSRCLQSVNGYEVREIYITYHPRNPEEYKGTKERELSIGFIKENDSGIITHVRPTLENNESFGPIMRTGGDVTDMRRRLEILEFVENFRNFYTEKDTAAIRQIFDDDALIVTAKVIKPAPKGDSRVFRRPEIVYTKQDKETYLNNLKRLFARVRYIGLSFDSIVVKAHPTKENYYGVMLKQDWKNMDAHHRVTYNDNGYLFLLWEFPEGESPKIHVRTWQPEWMDNTHTHRNVPDDVEEQFNHYNIPDKPKR